MTAGFPPDRSARPDLRDARITDLPAIVGIYNAAIPDRLATADTAPVSVASREAWFAEFSPGRRPLWVATMGENVVGWLSLRSFYGRPAYHATVELAVYVDPAWHRRGLADALLVHAIARAPALGIRTLLAFVFGHNRPSLRLFGKHGFARWGTLPGVCELDGVERDVQILGRKVGLPTGAERADGTGAGER